MTFIFRNRTIFWDILKWNRGQKKWDGGSNPKYAYYTKVDVQLFFDFPKIQKVQNNGQVSPNSNIIEMISTFICFVVNVLNNWNLLELDIHSLTHTHPHTHISSSLANVSLFCKINFDNLAFDPFFFLFLFILFYFILFFILTWEKKGLVSVIIALDPFIYLAQEWHETTHAILELAITWIQNS